MLMALSVMEAVPLAEMSQVSAAPEAEVKATVNVPVETATDSVAEVGVPMVQTSVPALFTAVNGIMPQRICSAEPSLAVAHQRTCPPANDSCAIA